MPESNQEIIALLQPAFTIYVSLSKTPTTSIPLDRIP